MKFIFGITLLFFIYGCSKDPVSIVASNNPQVPVSLMFETDGCKVYRFEDDGRYHYFSNCKGSINSTYSCGKNCTHQEMIATEVHSENQK